MIIATEHFATHFQEFKASTTERIWENVGNVSLIWENVMGHDTIQAEHMKQQG